MQKRDMREQRNYIKIQEEAGRYEEEQGDSQEMEEVEKE